MRRWIHRAAGTGVATAGMLLLGSGLVTAETQQPSTPPEIPAGHPSADIVDGIVSGSAVRDAPERIGADMPMPAGEPTQRDRISPYLQPRPVHLPVQAEQAGECAAREAAGMVQQHPIHVRD